MGPKRRSGSAFEKTGTEVKKVQRDRRLSKKIPKKEKQQSRTHAIL